MRRSNQIIFLISLIIISLAIFSKIPDPNELQISHDQAIMKEDQSVNAIPISRSYTLLNAINITSNEDFNATNDAWIWVAVSMTWGPRNPVTLRNLSLTKPSL